MSRDMNREAIEAAAARAGVRITDGPGGLVHNRVNVGARHYILIDGDVVGAWADSGTRPLLVGRHTLEEAFAAIAADIDEIASVRVERQSAELTPRLALLLGPYVPVTRECDDLVRKVLRLIDAHASVRAERTAEDERADVVACLTDVATKCRRKGRYDGFAEGILHALHVVSVRAHVGAAGGE